MNFDRTRVRPLPPAAARRPILEAHDTQGCLFIFNPSNGIVVTQAAGHFSVMLAEKNLESLEPLRKSQRKLAFFNDWEQMESYDSSARKKLTDWTIAHRTHFDGAWILTGSRMVAMGVAVANVATELVGLRLHASNDRKTWEKILLERLGAR